MIKINDLISRQRSVVTGKANLKKLYSFNNFPVFMGCVDRKQEKDMVADMNWVIDPESGVIQLERLLPLKLVYQNQHNDGIGKVWDGHYQKFAEFLSKFSPKKVLEIGAANGIVVNKYLKIDSSTDWTIIEPHPLIKANTKTKVVKAWFEDKKVDRIKKMGFDTFVHTHVLEHIYDPNSFLKNINMALKLGDKHIFSVPNMYEQLRRKYANCLNFEHTIFLTEGVIDFLLKKTGFKILKKKYFRDHSIFYATEKISDYVRDNDIKIPRFFKQNVTLFKNFVDYHNRMVSNLNKKIANSKVPVYVFGAHIFTQVLFNFGLDESLIATVLDNSKEKQNRRLYGTKFIVKSPKILQGRKKVCVILKAGAYNREIKSDILNNINPNIKFI
jgi:2-polyprenyl-3-methyl-5-hydroxy-6-metoxy-1,4-benzoquinol methylase